MSQGAARSTQKAASGIPRKSAKRAAARPGPLRDEANSEAAVLGKIAAMPAPYRAMGERLHAIIMAGAPGLTPRIWYGMPAYARDGKVLCFFRGGQVFKERYMTLGFSDKAGLDDGPMWPVAFALTAVTPAVETWIGALVKQAAS